MEAGPEAAPETEEGGGGRTDVARRAIERVCVARVMAVGSGGTINQKKKKRQQMVVGRGCVGMVPGEEGVRVSARRDAAA